MKLSPIQRELIYGSMMGDAKRQSPRSCASVGFGQSEIQRYYLKWKSVILNNIMSKKGIHECSRYDNRFGKVYTSHRFYCVANSDVEEILTKFYKTGKKVITQEILDNLTDFSLAVWYMDDGGTYWRVDKIERGLNPAPGVKLCTDSFSREENLMICNWLKNKYNINSYIESSRGRVQVNADSVERFLNIIKPHVIPPMLYKADYEAYKIWRKNKSDLNWFLKLPKT